MIDDEPPGGGAPVSVFESGAILVYLGEKTGNFLPKHLGGRFEVLQWLFWQMGGLGPMAGQNHDFSQYAPEKLPYAIERYVNETSRLYAVLDKRLADREFIAGAYSIADMASYPWVVPYERQGQKLEDFPNLKRWFETIKARPAAERAYARAKEFQTVPVTSDEARKVLFGQSASKVRGGEAELARDTGEGGVEAEARLRADDQQVEPVGELLAQVVLPALDGALQAEHRGEAADQHGDDHAQQLLHASGIGRQGPEEDERGDGADERRGQPYAQIDRQGVARAPPGLGQLVARLARFLAAQQLQAIEHLLQRHDLRGATGFGGRGAEHLAAQLVAALLVAAQPRCHRIARHQRLGKGHQGDEDADAGDHRDGRLVEHAVEAHISNFTILAMTPTPVLIIAAPNSSM